MTSRRLRLLEVKKLPTTHPSAGNGPGEVVDVLFVEASAPVDGQSTFVVPHSASDQTGPPPVRFVTVKVDDKDISPPSAIDGRPLRHQSRLVKRLPKWTSPSSFRPTGLAQRPLRGHREPECDLPRFEGFVHADVEGGRGTKKSDGPRPTCGRKE